MSALQLISLYSSPAPQGLAARDYTQPSNSQLVKKVTRATKPLFEQQAPVTDHMTNFEYVQADSSWGVRSPTDALSSSPDLNALNGGLRQTTVIPAAITFWKAAKAQQQAEKIGDHTGQTLSRFEKVGSAVQMGYAFTGIAGKVAALWSAFKPNPAVITALSTIGKILGYLVIPVYIFPAICGGYQAVKARAFYKDYEASGKSFEFLVNSIYVQLADIEALKYSSAAAQIPIKPGVKGSFSALAAYTLQERGLDLNTMPLDQIIEELELTTYEEYYLSRYTHGQEDDLSILGLLLAIKNKQEVNEATLGRSIGADCVASIKKSGMKGLEERLESEAGPVLTKAQEELEAIQTQIETSYTRIQRVNVALCLFSTLTVVLGCITVALALANPISLIIITVLWTLLALSWIVFDIYMAEQFDGRPGKYDKLLLKILTTVVLIGGALSIGTAIVAGGPVTIAIAIVLFLLLMGNSAYTFRRIDKLEAQWKVDHPTLNDVKAHELKGSHDLFKKLDKHMRRRITETAAGLGFENPLFKKWDAQGKFAEKYLKSFFLKQYTSNGIHFSLVQRATKKATKHYWTAFKFRPNDLTAKAQALGLQELLHALEAGNLAKAQRLYKQLDGAALETLHTQITRVFKRDWSFQSLSQAIEATESPQPDII